MSYPVCIANAHIKILDQINRLVPAAVISRLYEEAREEHSDRYKFFRRIRLYENWRYFFGIIAIIGVGCFIAAWRN